MDSIERSHSGAPDDELVEGFLGRGLPYLEIIVSLFAASIGAVQLFGLIVSWIARAISMTFEMPSLFIGWPLQGLLLVVLGYMNLKIGRAFMKSEPWAFSSSLYMNLLCGLVLYTIGPLGFVPALLSLVLILMLFAPSVKKVWYEEFREDMGPRTKELKYSLHLVRKSPLVVVGIVVIVGLVAIAFLAPWITPYASEERVWNDTKAPPGSVASEPKFEQRGLRYWNRTDVQLLPNYTRQELAVLPDEVATSIAPNVHFSITVKNTTIDAQNVTIYTAVYNLTLAEFDSMSETDRQEHLLGSKIDHNWMRSTVSLGNTAREYVWVYWFNATQKTDLWEVDVFISFRYNYYYPVHIWGADETGGDVFSRIIWASQVDLKISLSIVLVAIASGSLIGAASGYFGGKLDEIVMRVTDIFFAFPGLILAMAIVMALGARSLDNIAIALMITWWPVYARLVRGQVLSEREKLYVEAARSIGASDTRILLAHILPNTIQPVIVQGTLDTGGVLLTAAGLAFIGFGPPTGSAEWGLMISTGQQFLFSHPWMSMYPGLAILITALAFNLVGDGIRDILDPKLRRR